MWGPLSHSEGLGAQEDTQFAHGCCAFSHLPETRASAETDSGTSVSSHMTVVVTVTLRAGERAGQVINSSHAR